MQPSEKQLEVFRVLYPIFKEEVFKRREQMMKLTAFSSTFLVIWLITLLVIFPQPRPIPSIQWLVISGVALFSSLFAYFILQQADRHRMAKQQLIVLEQNLGLYQDEWQTNGDTFFPKSWQCAWTTDRSVTIYLSILAALTALVICAVLIQA